jgi:hypothetical protein
MLPDFPEVKKHLRSWFARNLSQQILAHAPILDGVRRTRIHEGRTVTYTRADKTSDEFPFQTIQAEVPFERSLMRRVSPAELLDYISRIAKQLAEQQTKFLLERLSEASASVGNTVSAQELGLKQAFLEMERKLQIDFDPDTLEPKGLVIMTHPDQGAKIRAQAAGWEADPEFIAERNAIRLKKIEEWRARENRRRLVD